LARSYDSALKLYNHAEWGPTALTVRHLLEGLCARLLPAEKRDLPLPRQLETLPRDIDLTRPLQDIAHLMAPDGAFGRQFEDEAAIDKVTAENLLELARAADPLPGGAAGRTGGAQEPHCHGAGAAAARRQRWGRTTAPARRHTVASSHTCNKNRASRSGDQTRPLPWPRRPRDGSVLLRRIVPTSFAARGPGPTGTGAKSGGATAPYRQCAAENITESFMTRKGAGEGGARNLSLRWGYAPPAIQTFSRSHHEQTTARSCSPPLSAPSRAPPLPHRPPPRLPPSATPANATAPAKTTVTKHKHMAKAKKDVKSDKAPAASDAKKS
jgi:hypothetical protein